MKRIIMACLMVLCLTGRPGAQTYSQQAALAQDSNFQSRVKVAAFKTAIQISVESTATANHNRRVAFAQLFASNADELATKIAFAVAAFDVTTTAASSDATIQNGVNAVWDTFAGKDPA